VSATPLAMRVMESSTCLRTSPRYVRTVSFNCTSSGMMLHLLPPWIEPTVTTAGSKGDFSRLVMVCSARISCAEMTTGSLVVSGGQGTDGAFFHIQDNTLEIPPRRDSGRFGKSGRDPAKITC